MGRLYLLALSTLTLAIPYAQAQTGGVLPRSELEALLRDTTKSLQNLVIARSQQVPAEVANLKNPFGRNFKDDLVQSVMVPEAQARLDARLTSAANDLAAGDLPGVQLTLNNARREIRTEIERYQSIMDYWGAVSLGRRGSWTQQDLLPGKRFPGSANPYPDLGITTPYDAELDELNAKLDTQIEARDFIPAMRVTWPRIRELRTLAAIEQSRQLLAKLDSGELKDLRSEKRSADSPCVPAKRTSGQPAPILATDFAPAPSAPASSGAPTANAGTAVIAIVSAEGCAEQALLARRADANPTEIAALHAAANGRYLPAGKDGTAIRSAVMFRTAPGN